MIGPGRMFSDGVVTLLVFFVTALGSGLRAMFFIIWAVCTMITLIVVQYELSISLHDVLNAGTDGTYTWSAGGMMVDYLRAVVVIFFGSTIAAIIREVSIRRIWLAVGAAGYHKDRYHLGESVKHA